MATTEMVLCVATISEGKNQQVINDLKNSLESNELISLLDVSSFKDSTIMTFAGSSNDILKGAFDLCNVAYHQINMTNYKGSGGQFGAISDISFAPVREGISEIECTKLVARFGQMLTRELPVNVYFYAENYSRKDILKIRSAGYEAFIRQAENGFAEQPNWGTAVYPEVKGWGSTLICDTQREFLHLNFNILATKEQTLKIALNIQELGRQDDQDGPLKGCRASVSWLEKSGIAQLNLSIQDTEICSLQQVYEEIRKETEMLALPILGSQIIGLIRLKTLLEFAEYYIKKDKLYVLEERHKIELAISKLGLRNGGDGFVPENRIIEYLLPDENSRFLIEKSVEDFIRTVGARIPVPAGGAVAATVASLGAALVSMAAKMTYGKKKWEKFDSQMRRLIPIMHNAMDELMLLVDEDTRAFNQLIDSSRLPQNSQEEITRRKEALDQATFETIRVPLELAQQVSLIWETFEELAAIITKEAISDLRVAAWCFQLAVKAAHSSIIENLKEFKNDENYKELVSDEIENYRNVAKIGKRNIHIILDERKD